MTDRKSNNISKSDFAIMYLGADYVINRNLRIGLLGQYDRISQEGQLNQSDSSGTGWMVGPYVAWRLENGLLLSGRAAWGQSTNTINPLGRYEDEFDANRMLVSAKVSQEIQLYAREAHQWSLRPEASLYYFKEEQQAFKSALGPLIGSHAISLGELRFGPEFIYRSDLTQTSDLEWTLKLLGVASYDPPDLVGETGVRMDALDRYSARFETGLRLQADTGFVFNARLNFDGIGSGSYQSYGASISVNKAF